MDKDRVHLFELVGTRNDPKGLSKYLSHREITFWLISLGLVGTGFASRCRLYNRVGFKGTMGID